jgi:MFS family permease
MAWSASVPVWSLCITQVISWGTLYYAFSALQTAIRPAHPWDPASVMGAFSFCLLVSGLAAYPAGLAIQKWGGRWTMTAGSLTAAVSLAVVAEAASLRTFYFGWGLAGVAMSLSLYDAAFAALAGISKLDYRRAVTTVTLAGGFASTVFWPLTEWLASSVGWRATLHVYVALHLLVCLPLHQLGGLDTGRIPLSPLTRTTHWPGLLWLGDSRFLLLAGSFTLNSLVFSCVTVHLIPVLQSAGSTSSEAAWFAACVGPMQVAGRVGELALGGRHRAIDTGRFALALLIPALAALSYAKAGPAWMLVAVGAYGVSNGLMTIVRSVSVVELFGRDEYPRISGAIGAMPTLARAAGPITASLVLARTGSYRTVLAILIVSSIASFLLFAAAASRPSGPAVK